MRISNVGIQIHGDPPIMGKVMIRDRAGKLTTVDKSWTFKKGDDNRVRIVLHHSSLSTPAKKPYGPHAANLGSDICLATPAG